MTTTGRTEAHGYDTGAWVAPARPPSWLGSVRGSRVALRPGLLWPYVALGAFAGLVVLVTAYGAVRLDAAWSVLAGLAGLGALALARRGLPFAGGLALLAGVACWAFVTRSLVPLRGVVGVLALVGGNLAFAAPLVAGFAAAIWADACRVAVAAVDSVVGAAVGRRWFGVNRGEPEPQLPALEQIPAVRFFALPQGQCSHIAVAGRRVALIASSVWPRGSYGVADNEITRNGRPYAPGTDEVDGTVDDLRAWTTRLAPAGAVCRAFLVVHPASGRLTDAVRLDVPVLEGVTVVAAAEFVEAAGAFLAADAHTLSVPVLEPLIEALARP